MPLGKEAWQFMAELWDNNSKEWFDQNRKRYETVLRDPFKAVALALHEPIAALLPELSGKPKISRINKDIRFAPDAPPYKEHVWCSFGEGQAVIFFGLSREGWSSGCMIGSPKRDDLHHWRRNLVDHHETWARYIESMSTFGGLRTHIGNAYKKPLYDDIPDSVLELVQAKDLVLYTTPRADTGENIEKELFAAVAAMVPAWYFMSSPMHLLKDHLKRLNGEMTAPFDEVEKVWSSIE